MVQEYLETELSNPAVYILFILNTFTNTQQHIGTEWFNRVLPNCIYELPLREWQLMITLQRSLTKHPMILSHPTIDTFFSIFPEVSGACMYKRDLYRPY